MTAPKTIVVGLSGGVDSAVTALLLKQQGYRVIGLFMKNWEGDDEDAHCAAAQDLADAQAVCARLNIPLETANFAKDYWDRVFQLFLAEYRAGRTPNPDVLCNKEIKFKAFLDHAFVLGADFIATGHYARLARVGDQVHLLKGSDQNKDQSYFLHQLNQTQLQASLFPLGEYQKPKVRQLAKEHGLINHNKKDSTGICFVGERKFKTFLNEYLLAQPGPITTPEGTPIGQHDGLMFYTLGQRQGLKIGGLKHASEAPWYVVGKDIPTNKLIVAQGQDHPMLFRSTLTCQNPHWINSEPPSTKATLTAKTRYRQADQPCEITIKNKHLTASFKTPQRAITPGQYAVFYENDHCLGGGVID